MCITQQNHFQQQTMYCSVEQCTNCQIGIKQNKFSKEELGVLLIQCFKCSHASNTITAKLTSHLIDIAFAEKITDELHNNESLPIKLDVSLNWQTTEEKTFSSWIKDFKTSICEHNCLNKKEEEELLELIQKAITRGEIILYQREGDAND